MIDTSLFTQYIAQLNNEEVLKMIDIFLDTNPSSSDVKRVIDSCQEGLIKVGDLFERGQYYIGDLIISGELVSTVVERLKPAMSTPYEENKGTIVLGTVKGDLHDIGKNIFKIMSKASGFIVYDLGIDQPPSAFVEAVADIKPDIVGLSAVITTVLPSMKDILVGLNEAGLRDSVKVIIGGAAVSEVVYKHIGADAYTIDAAKGVRICRKWMEEKAINSLK